MRRPARGQRASLTFVFSLLAVGCAGTPPANLSPTPSGSPAPSPQETAQPSASPIATPSPGLTASPLATDAGLEAELIAPGSLVICSAFPRARFSEYDAQGNPFGVDIDIALALAEELALEPEVREVEFENLINAIVERQCDIAVAGHFITQERLDLIDLIPYREGSISPVVTAGNPLAIDTLTDLCGRTVAIIEGTIYFDIIRGLGEYSDEGIDQQCLNAGKPAVKLVEIDTEDDAVARLTAGDADAFIGNEAVALDRPAEFELSDAELPRLRNGIGHRLASPVLDASIRAALRTLIDDGTYAAILQRYGASSGALTERP